MEAGKSKYYLLSTAFPAHSQLRPKPMYKGGFNRISIGFSGLSNGKMKRSLISDLVNFEAVVPLKGNSTSTTNNGVMYLFVME
ncbi:hypothetical protein FACS1894211_09570 [Clostridia bacterium]|nr:hypothetical protein FACS1894211_09570 [Clostridia bacterium]